MRDQYVVFRDYACPERIFSVCAPSQYVMYVMRPPVTELVPLHNKSLYKNMTRASGGSKYYAPTKVGAGEGEKGTGPERLTARLLL